MLLWFGYSTVCIVATRRSHILFIWKGYIIFLYRYTAQSISFYCHDCCQDQVTSIQYNPITGFQGIANNTNTYDQLAVRRRRVCWTSFVINCIILCGGSKNISINIGTFDKNRTKLYYTKTYELYRIYIVLI